MIEGTLNHPDDESLRALSLGQLTEAEVAYVSTHLGDCPTCCRRIDQVATDDHLLARLQQSAAVRETVLVSRAQRRSAVRALQYLNEGSSATRERDSKAGPVILPAPKRLGDYDILAEVGRGGMGVVYKAWHRGLRRLAALKMVLAGEFASSAQELRFRLEAELAARVLHPNFVQVFEIGNFEGRPFLALEWVEGGSLANRMDGKPWPPGEAASLIETLARAIDVAHGEGVVHRDLKPANILLQKEESGRMKDGFGLIPHPSSFILPKITDFGLAQTIGDGQAITQSGFLVGTPGYMSPEQASGNRALAGPATDIYALGVVLYQLLTGQLPFQRDSTLDLLRAVTYDEPTRPRRLQPRLPRDLEAITLHCLEKQPGRRYPTALALAEDLQRFREGKQVVARPVGAVARLSRACRRRPLEAVLLALLAVSLFGGMGGVTWKWLEANEQRDVANANARRADAEKQMALYQAYRACMAAASAALQNNNVVDAARHLTSAPEALRGWEWRHVHSRLDGARLVLHVPGGTVLSFVLNPSGRQIAVCCLDHNEVYLFNVATGRLEAILRGHSAPVASIAYRPDGKRVASGSEDQTIRLWDAATGQQIALLRAESAAPNLERASLVAYNSDGSRIASSAGWGWDDVLYAPAGTSRLWDATTAKELAVLAKWQEGDHPIAFNPDGPERFLNHGWGKGMEKPRQRI